MTREKLSESERPINHWSQREIADEAMRRGLVPSISQRPVGRFLKMRPTSKPHRARYWLTPKPDPALPSARHLQGLYYKAAAGAASCF
jgi:hypothetical protein